MGKTVMRGTFEWDEEKNEINRKKHGFGFEEILNMFDDPFFFEIYDSVHSDEAEDRYIGIGRAQGVLVVTTCYTERTGRIRLISSRRATPKEEMMYYGEQNNFLGRQDQ